MVLKEVYICEDGMIGVSEVKILKETEKQYKVEKTRKYLTTIQKRGLKTIEEGPMVSIGGGNYQITKYAICLPEDVEEVKQAMKQEIREDIMEQDIRVARKKEFYKELLK